MNDLDELFKTQSLELRRGNIILAVLSNLDEEMYGYSLLQILDKNKLPIDAGTLYPLLRRLEKQDLLDSKWDTSDSRPRKYYKISTKGEKIFDLLKREWFEINKNLKKMLKKGNK